MNTTNTVYIRPLRPEDTEPLHALRVRNRAFFQPFEPIRSDADFTLEGIRRQIAQAMLDAEEDRGYAFGLFRLTDDELVGRINLSSIVRAAWQNANLGYYVDQAASGQGYATQAVRQALMFAFSEANLHRVQAAVLPRNAASSRVLEKAGFRREGLAERYLQINGRWEDHLIYAVTAEDCI